MELGSIKVAHHQGVYVIKMTGDVRLTLSLPFDNFIDEMLKDADFCSVIFDLSHVEAVDSTTLGLMAKISILSKPHIPESPMIICDSASIKRLLDSMGFDDIFNIVQSAYLPSGMFLEEVSETSHQDDDSEEKHIETEAAVKQKVIEAHRYLVGLNSQNAETFKELLDTLQSEN